MRRIKIIVLSLLLIALPVLQFSPAYAVNIFKNVCSTQNAGKTGGCKDTAQQASSHSNVFISTIKDVINLMSFITGVAAIIMLVVSGLRMTLSAGEASTVKEAKGGIIGALVGILIVVFAQAIVIFVLNRIK